MQFIRNATITINVDAMIWLALLTPVKFNWAEKLYVKPAFIIRINF